MAQCTRARCVRYVVSSLLLHARWKSISLSARAPEAASRLWTGSLQPGDSDVQSVLARIGKYIAAYRNYRCFVDVLCIIIIRERWTKTMG